MEPYVYIPYPKCLYNQNGDTMTVDNEEEHSAAAEMGWMTAEQFHTPKVEPPVPPVPGSDEIPGTPEGEEGHK